jgi:hypothetical protein
MSGAWLMTTIVVSQRPERAVYAPLLQVFAARSSPWHENADSIDGSRGPLSYAKSFSYDIGAERDQMERRA